MISFFCLELSCDIWVQSEYKNLLPFCRLCMAWPTPPLTLFNDAWITLVSLLFGLHAKHISLLGPWNLLFPFDPEQPSPRYLGGQVLTFFLSLGLCSWDTLSLFMSLFMATVHKIVNPVPSMPYKPYLTVFSHGISFLECIPYSFLYHPQNVSCTKAGTWSVLFTNPFPIPRAVSNS